MPRTGTRQHLSVFLLKDTVLQFDDALAKPADWVGKEVALDLGPGTSARLYPKVQRGKSPKWMAFLQSGIAAANPYRNYRPMSAAALIVVKIEAAPIQSAATAAGIAIPRRDYWFALSFGYGYQYLGSVWEPRFGFHIALNVADQEGFRQVDLSQHAGRTLNTQVSSSKLSTLYALGFDSEQDIIKRIVAKLDQARQSLAFRIVGRDNVAIACDLRLSGLRDKCIALLIESTKVGYKARFPDVEAITEVRDRTLHPILDALMVAQLNQSNPSSLHFAPPESVQLDEQFEGFMYESRPDADPAEEITRAGLLAALGNPAQIGLAELKREKVRAVRTDGTTCGGPWSAYKTVVVEVPHGTPSRQYGLMDGLWFEFDNDFVRELDAYINGLSITNDLAAFPRNGETSEDTYLMTLKSRRGIGGVIAHKEFVMYGGGRSKIEVCDILLGPDTTGRLLLAHVKGSGGGEETGHLANQAATSLELMIDEDQSFRIGAITKLSAQATRNGFALPAQFPDSGQSYRVVFAVFVNQVAPLSQCLTLFGKVVLRRVAKRLRKFNCELSVELLLP